MFRFTIREMFLLLVIVALGLGWWVDHRRMSTELASAKKWQHAAGAAEAVLNNLGWKTQWNFSEDLFEASTPGTYAGRGSDLVKSRDTPNIAAWSYRSVSH